jgi:hypothetical protein
MPEIFQVREVADKSAGAMSIFGWIVRLMIEMTIN